MNAPAISRAVSAYAAQLSLGTSVVEYLKIPVWDPANSIHRRLAQLAKEITARGKPPTQGEIREVDRLAMKILDPRA